MEKCSEWVRVERVKIVSMFNAVQIFPYKNVQ
jgi:hypothetical protein